MKNIKISSENKLVIDTDLIYYNFHNLDKIKQKVFYETENNYIQFHFCIDGHVSFQYNNGAYSFPVVKGNSILNKEGLRNNLEFVNHKILDCMGDLYLSGYRIIGSVKCSQGGHSITNKLLRKLFADKKNYSLIEIKGKNLPHSFANRSQLRSIA